MNFSEAPAKGGPRGKITSEALCGTSGLQNKK
jgi:hypothetical protein